MSTRQYIGARYVPKFYEGSLGNEWEANVAYEPLTIVTYLNNSYTSKKPVPSGVGNPSDNPNYWVSTGNYNAQVEAYRQETAELSYKVDLLTKRFIIISDSYGSIVDEGGKTIFDLIKNYLNIANDNMYSAYKGGASFGSAYNEYKFLTVLKTLENTVANPNTITDIIVIGGANDGGNSYETEISALRDFSAYCKTQYPNATINLAAVGLTFSMSEMALRFKNCLKSWKDAIQFGINFYTNSEYVLCNTELLADDYCHPNANGVKTIARCVANCIKTGSCDINYTQNNYTMLSVSVVGKELDLTVGGAGLSMNSNNGIVSFFSKDGGSTMMSFSSATALNLVKGDELRIVLDKTLAPGYYDEQYRTVIGHLVDDSKNPAKTYRVGIVFDNRVNIGSRLRIFLVDSIPSSDNVTRLSLAIDNIYAI